MVAWPVSIVWQTWIALGCQMGESLVGLIAIEDFYHLTIFSGTKRIHLERGYRSMTVLHID
jgi:hypothetical protein